MQVVQQRQARDVGGDDLAIQHRQFADQQQRIAAILQRIGTGDEGDGPVAVAIGGRRRRFGAQGEQIVEPGEAVVGGRGRHVRRCHGGCCLDLLRRRRRHQPRQHRAVGGRIGAIARGGDMIRQHVERPDDRAEQVRRQRQRTVADEVQQRFVFVGERLQAFVAEGARTALDRMDRAEDRVDRFAVMAALTDGREADLHRGEAFVAFLKEYLLDLVEVHHRSFQKLRSSTVSRRASEIIRVSASLGWSIRKARPRASAVARALARTCRQA